MSIGAKNQQPQETYICGCMFIQWDENPPNIDWNFFLQLHGIIISLGGI